jgi:hypothetical protein
MRKNVLFILLIGGWVMAAQLDTLTRSSSVVTTTELESYVTDPTSLQEQITSNAVAIAALQVFHP